MTTKQRTTVESETITVPAVTEPRVIVGEVGGYAGLVGERRPGRVEVTEAMARGEVDPGGTEPMIDPSGAVIDGTRK